MNVKTTFNIVLLGGVLLASSALLGCSSDSTGSSSGIGGESDAKARAASFIPGGTAETASQTEDEGKQVWFVVVKATNGALVQVYLLPSGDLQELKDFTGPFDYRIPSPVAGQLSYDDAKTKALAAKPGTVTGWEFAREEPPEFQYEFYVRDADQKLFEIKLTGDKGDVKSIVEKASMD